ncbi:SPRY domain protein [Necator americanus]|uniref:SPRY domain-containing protein 7 n=1 Tax=Necator americanus TaxID=51031 RepID=W2SLC4_NECAM|nr:SPRY domain protein [Necator americanus]ETN69542.1 SPRY domain protein [Necator americanus]
MRQYDPIVRGTVVSRLFLAFIEKFIKGKDVVILKEGERICGTGAALGTLPIVQNKAYFQVDVQQNGTWGVGLGNSHTPLDAVPVASDFWGVRDNGDIVANATVLGKLNKPISEGDTIGVCYDHVELKFLVNGEWAEPSITGVRGPAYPIIYVDESAIIDVKFRKFTEDVPSGYDEILAEQTLL